MSLVRDKDGRRLHLKSRIMGESLVSRAFIDQLDVAPQVRHYPDVAIVEIGARDLMQRDLGDLEIEKPYLEIIEAYPAASCRESSQ